MNAKHRTLNGKCNNIAAAAAAREKHTNHRRSTPPPYSRTGLSSSAMFFIAIILLSTVFAIDSTNGSQLVLPHHCESVKCPPISEISCPHDSDERDSFRAWGLLMANSNNGPDEGDAEDAGSTSGSLAAAAAALIQTINSTDNDAVGDHLASTTERAEELFAQCCLSKKCICRTCYVPDCTSDDEVVVALVPESPDMPGFCCGQYECHREPNCTEVRETDTYWLTDCQRCRCYAGERICHQSCDEGIKKPTPICQSKTLNKFFENGEVWKDGCQECECVNGEEKCVMPFCRGLPCPPHRQVMIKGMCCKVCWPNNAPMPYGHKEYDEDNEEDVTFDERNYDDNVEEKDDTSHNEYTDHEEDTLPNNIFVANETSTTTTTTTTSTTPTTDTSSTTTTTTTTTTTIAPTSSPNTQSPEPQLSTTESPVMQKVNLQKAFHEELTVGSGASPPCRHESAPATYQIYPVEVVRQSPQTKWLYGVICLLLVVSLMLAIWVTRLRAKQRSYAPVSDIDDNCNKTSCKIKKTTDFA